VLKKIIILIAFTTTVFFVSSFDSVRLWWLQGSALPEINLASYAGDQITIGGVSSEGPAKVIYILVWSVADENSIKALKTVQLLMNKSVIYANQFYAVNVDSLESKTKSVVLVDENEFSFKLLLDFEKKIIENLNFSRTPFLLALSNKGVVLHASNNFDDSLEKKIQKINLNF
jgi:hypothetical protein